MSDMVADLIAKKFIARKDVKAVQFTDGTWAPHTTTRRHDGPRIPWSRTDLNTHLEGTSTFGHYMLNTEDQCKLFAFDIDLEKNGDPEKESEPYVGHWPEFIDGFEFPMIHQFDARETWLIRSHPSRSWQKYQLKLVAHSLVRTITEELALPCAAAYSGGKGVHVYGFTGLISAADAREGAQIVLDTVGGWEASRGNNFFRSVDTDPTTGFPNLSIEIFPKQDSLAGKDLGNLMRLPLGRNLKSKDPTFFLDMTSPMGQMIPVDAEYALSTSNPWKKPNE